MLAFIAANLDVERLVREHPPVEVEKFKADRLRYLLHCLYAVPARNKQIELVNGFVPLHAAALQRRVHDYRQYLDYLIRTKVLETNNRYIVGETSKGYRYTKKYQTGLRPVELTDRTLCRQYKKSKRVPERMSKKYRYLFKWFTPDLTIEHEAALHHIKLTLQRKRDHPHLRDKHPRTRKPKDPYAQYAAAHIHVEWLAQEAYYCWVDRTVQRLHSNLTSMPKVLRPYVRYGGAPLVGIDLVNSQPFLSAMLLQPAFWKRGRAKELLRIEEVISIQKHFKSHPQQSEAPYFMLEEITKMQAQSDFQRYIRLVTQGQFYEYMEKELGQRLGAAFANRGQVKATVLMVLYSSNSYMPREKRVFRDLFPSVYRVFDLLKEGDHRRLPRLLQRLESHLFLRVIAKRIGREHPKLPLFTIHDNIVTTMGNEGLVMRIMQEELSRAIGYAPILRPELWMPGALDEEDEEEVPIEEGEIEVEEGALAGL